MTKVNWLSAIRQPMYQSVRKATLPEEGKKEKTVVEVIAQIRHFNSTRQ